jgi:hypothetical protein
VAVGTRANLAVVKTPAGMAFWDLHSWRKARTDLIIKNAEHVTLSAGNVSLTCNGAPTNSTCTASPSSVALNGTRKFTIHLLSPKNVNLGTFTVVFTGKLATLTHTANVTLTVK